MSRSKKVSRLSGLTLAVGLGVAVSTGVAAAEPSDSAGEAANSSSPDSSNPSSESASSTAGSNTGRPTVGDTSKKSSDKKSHDKSGDRADEKQDTTSNGSAETVTEPESTAEPTQSEVTEEKPAEPEASPRPAPPTEPTKSTNGVEATTKSNDSATRATGQPTPTRDADPIPRAVQISSADVARQTPTRASTAAKAPEPPAALRVSSSSTTAAASALTAAPIAVPAPAPTVARTPIGPLTGLLALFGLRPSAPGTPATPLTQIVELLWVAVRRVEHTFLNQSPRATTPTLNGQDPTTGVITGKVGAVDPDPEDRLTYTVVDGPDHGAVSVNADGAFTYTPDSKWAHETPGTDTFTVQASDAGNGFHLHLFSRGHTATVPVAIQVGRINQAPEIISATPTTPDPHTGHVTYTIVTRDRENDAVTVTASDPAHGDIVRNSNGTYTYTPDREFAHGLAAAGSDPITFTATDKYGAASSLTVSAPITPLNDDPVINGAASAITAAGDVTIELSVTDGDGDSVKVTLPEPVHGTFTSVTVTDDDGDTVTVTPAAGLQLDLSATDVVTIVYRPNRVAGAPDAEDLTFVGDDGHGGTATATVAAPIALPNLAPTITVGTPTVVDAATGELRYPVTIIDPDGDPFVVTVSLPAHGTLTRNADGSYTYIPDKAYAHGLSAGGSTTPGADSYRFAVADQFGAAALTIVSVSVAPQNTAPYQDAPSVANDPDADGTVTGQVFLRDNEIDGITYAITSSKGTVTIDGNGNFTFDPSAQARQQAAAVGASTEDKQAIVVITANDGHGGQLTLEVTVDVLPATGNTITFADGATPNDVFVPANDPSKIYVLTGDELRIVDTTTRAVVRTIELGGYPSGIVMSPDARYVYVGKVTTGTEFGPVIKIDTQTGAATPIQGVVRQPSAMAISSDGATLYVTNRMDGTVSVINTATGEFYTINTGLQSDAIAVSADGRTLYVGSIINDVRVVDIAARTYTVVATGTYDGSTVAVQSITVAGRYVYVTDAQNDKVAVIDSVTNAVVARVNVGDRPLSVAVSPGGAFVFVANSGGDSVSVMDTESGTAGLTIPVGNNPTHVDLSSDGTRLYVSTSDGVSIVPTADLYFLVGGSGSDGPGWAVGGGVGVGGGGPVLPPIVPGGGLGGGGTGPTLPPIVPGGPGPIHPPGEIAV